MSRRQAIPSNIFYRQADPLPPLFPDPTEGDVYFNTLRGVLRIFSEDRWKDVAAGGTSGSGGIWIVPGHAIQEDGADLPTRAKLNFTGVGVTAVDDSARDAIKVVVPEQTIVSTVAPSAVGLPEGTWWVDSDSSSAVPAVALTTPEQPDPASLPEGTIWVDPNSDV